MGGTAGLPPKRVVWALILVPWPFYCILSSVARTWGNELAGNSGPTLALRIVSRSPASDVL